MQNRSRRFVVSIIILAAFIFGAANLFFATVSVAFADQDITPILKDVSISGAVQNEDGVYQVRPGIEYEITLHFQERGPLQFDENQTLVYDLPD